MKMLVIKDESMKSNKINGYSYSKEINEFERYIDVKTDLVQGNRKVGYPFISIVIPTYRREDLLRRSLESALNQDYNDYEILVIDNDPERYTKTECIMRKYTDSKVLYYKNNKNIGQIGNWNRGITLANGKWIVMLHDDDFLMPDYLKKVSRCIMERLDIEGLFVTAFKETVSADNRKSRKSRLKNRFLQARYKSKEKYQGLVSEIKFKDYYFDCGINSPSGAIYKRSNILDLGGFQEDAFPISDWEFHLRYITKYNFWILFDNLIVIRNGDSDSVKLDIRRGFVKKGFEIRIEMLKHMNTLYGKWWIDLVTWRHTLEFQQLDESEIKELSVNRIWRYHFMKILYYIVVFSYSSKLKYLVPNLENMEYKGEGIIKND
jgi:glycosyltransferase